MGSHIVKCAGCGRAIKRTETADGWTDADAPARARLVFCVDEFGPQHAPSDAVAAAVATLEGDPKP